MDTLEKSRNRKGPGAAKGPRRKNAKNGLKHKDEKPSLNAMGPDPGGGGGVPHLGAFNDLSDGLGDVKGGLPDDLLLNGTDLHSDNPSTPLLEPKLECPDMGPLSGLGHPDFPDCKPQMNPYNNCYPPYNNNMPPNNNMCGPGDYGPPPHQMGNYGPSGPTIKQQPSTMDAQFMQQQSQIFVFSTQLANNAAEAVYQQRFDTIINFHNAQPTTKQFLELNRAAGSMQQPMPNFKMNNKIGRQFPGNQPWPPSGPPSKRNKTQHNPPPPPPPGPNMGMPGGPPQNMPPDFNGPHHGGPFPPNWPAHGSPPQKPGQPGFPNYGYDNGPFCGAGMGPQQGPNPKSQMMGPQGPPGAPPMPPGMQMPGYFPGGPNNHGPPGGGPGGPQGPMPPGIKIPDENLTPQQRLHREEQLAKVWTMKKLLFPENDDPHGHGPHGPGGPGCPPMPQPPDGMNPYDMPGGPGSQGQMGMDYNMSGQGMNGPGGKPMGMDWPDPSGNFFMDGQPPGVNKGPLPPPSNGPAMGNGPRSNKMGGGSIPSPATPLTPGSQCGPHHRPSPHSPASADPMYPGGGGPGGGSHSFFPQGYYSPQVGQGQDGSPSGAVQRKDSESSNSEGGKSRKDKSSCSISPTSSAPPSVKEANLMPVPSPQRIQYLNVFEGQELTIQKQPNIGLDQNEHSPGMPSSLDMNPPTPNMKPSLSAPPTPVSMANALTPKPSQDMSGPMSNKNRPGSVGPVSTPKNSTTPNPSPQGPDKGSLSQPGTPLQMHFDSMKGPGGGFGNHPSGMGPNGPGPQPPNCMMNKGPGMPMMDGRHPDGGPGGGVFDNVPLNPDISGPGPGAVKPAFDPISSMAQMSQQLTGGNGTPPNQSGGPNMGPNGGFGMNGPPGGPPMNPNMGFNTAMHGVQSVDGGMGIQTQTVNNTYVNATMTIQQMNIQNIPPYMSNNPMGGQQMGHQMGGHMGPMGPGGHPGHMPPMNNGPMQQQPGPMGMGPGGPGGPPMGSGPMGSSPMGPGGPMGGPPPNMGPMGPMCGPGGPRGPAPGSGGPPGSGPMMYGNQPPPRMGQNARNSPYRMPGNSNNPRAYGSGANVHVKASTPNTIQYLPARPPPPHNQGPMCPQSGAMPGARGPNLDFLQRYTNPSPGPAVNINMGMNVNVNMNSNRMPGYPGPPPPGMNSNGPPCGMMRGQHPPPHMMDQGPPQGPGGPMNPGQQLPPHMMNQGMKGPPQGYPGGPGGPQQGGPPQSDNPAYQQQFHHFQQQLYATGSTGGRNPMQQNGPPNPNGPPNQQYASNMQFK